MAASRSPIALLALCAILAALAAPASAALRLPIESAAGKSGTFAGRICAHDPSCVRHGVMNCRRQSRRVALCRIFDERDTPVQGRYVCHRLVRVALDPVTRRLPVTGLGKWNC